MAFAQKPNAASNSKCRPPVPPRPLSTISSAQIPPPVPPRRPVPLQNAPVEEDYLRNTGISKSTVRTSSVQGLVQRFQMCTQSGTSSQAYSNVHQSRPNKIATVKTSSSEIDEPIYEEIPASIPDSNSSNNDSYWSDSTFNSESDGENFDLTSNNNHNNNKRLHQLPDSKKPENVIEELQQNEKKYIETLLHGILNYIPLIYQRNLPEGLRGQKNNLFGNIEMIHEIHQDEFLPSLQRCYRDAQQIADCIRHFVETDSFYCYIQYALNRRKANTILEIHADFFTSNQHELNSFLLQPIQRLPRYKLFLDKLLKETLEFGEDHYTCDQLLKIREAQQKLSELIDLVNAAVCVSDIPQCSEEFTRLGPQCSSSTLNPKTDLPSTLILRPKGNKAASRNNPIDLLSQGKFRHMIDINIYDGGYRKWYKARFFIFEKLILYAEVLRNKLQYRGHYFDTEISYREEGLNKLYLFCLHPGTQEIQIHSKDQLLYNSIANAIKMIRRKAITQFFSDNHGSEIFTGATTGRQKYPEENVDELNITNHITTLISSQSHFCQVLRVNYDFYVRSLSLRYSSQGYSYENVFHRMIKLHNNRILADLSSRYVTIQGICDTFTTYIETDFPAAYCDYVKEFMSLCRTNTIQRTPANFNNLIVPTVGDFTALCIDHLDEFVRFFETIISDLTEKSTRNVTIDKALFQQLAVVQVELEKFTRYVKDNYRLFSLDDGLVSVGLVQTSEQVKVQTVKEITNCRIFICEKATVCVEIKEHTKQKEEFACVIFTDRFSGRGQPMQLRNSKKGDSRVNFVVSGIKFKIRFQNCQIKDRFYAKYVQQYVLIK